MRFARLESLALRMNPGTQNKAAVGRLMFGTRIGSESSGFRIASKPEKSVLEGSYTKQRKLEYLHY
jgi:hypothetical protein